MTIAIQQRHRRPAPTRRPLRFVAVFVALLFTFATPGLAFAWSDNSFSAEDEALLIQLTNQARASAGLNSLTVDATLTNVARWRSQDMVDRNYFSHSIPPDGKKVFDELKRIGYCYVAAGENLGTNTFPDDVATQTIQDGFLGSATHRSVMLGNWTVIGIGAYKGTGSKHVWTVLFATKCSSAPAATPKPTATPRPVVTPAPTPRPTTRPTSPAATVKPVLSATPLPTASPVPEVTASPSPTPEPLDPAEALGALGSRSPGLAGGLPAPSPEPRQTPDPLSAPGDTGGTAPPLQVIDTPFAGNLVDTIVGDVAGAYFGH